MEIKERFHINWNSHAVFQWRSGTLKMLGKRSILICSNQYLLQKELQHLRTVFMKINDCPANTVNDIIKKELQKENVDIANEPKANTTDNNETKIQLLFPISGKEGVSQRKLYHQKWRHALYNEDIKLSTKFQMKNRTKFERSHNTVYFSHHPKLTCNEAYEGEMDRSINECIFDHNKRGKDTHLLKHATKLRTDNY